ncbi:Riboflavin biosynthesis protein RibBA [Paraburkholderia domus]|uniref:bifunctional 3,4-dihydroxy-2-butanone-4-phosphate synthase/GTP cyclohydrolase II n=1 Tax=Paraburkholderia domus TaxID=2793075 RepID=UPI00191335DB|nr:bifunctional 3,4-dihydroxy-2-butanone-4-phosphate synthase/GTP cyclohydrolase II [Paraburkholderia domus]MBK5050476.1 3,4-dihydroxy-2-butanone-4-phosphate synthase [Burkholderia sp. R-70006]CAE6754249.1 Riboflavin biosynthesis protein RibBA [Paraburkholderia domus]
MQLSPTPEIIAELKAGRMVILMDQEDRENEGDLVLAADFVTPAAINFMARFGRGLICLTLTSDRCEQLNLSPMTQRNGARYGTAFTVSIEAATGVTTGISAADRAHTIATAVAASAQPEHIVQPGHVFPIIARPGGVLVRAGHTEAGCDLASLAGLTPAAVICEIIRDDGEMARLADLTEFARHHGLKMGTIADLIQYRSRNESIVERVAERTIQTVHGEFRAVLYRDRPGGSSHMALVRGTPTPDKATPVRVHEPVSVLDFLETGTSTHSWTLDAAIKEIAGCETGVVVLLDCTDSGDSLLDTFEAFNDPIKADALRRRAADFRTYGIGSRILRDQNVGKMVVLSNPRPLGAILDYGLEVVDFARMPGRKASFS